MISLPAPARLDLGTVHDFRMRVLTALERAGSVQLDLSAVTELGPSGGAVLVGCLRQARRAGRSLTVTGLTEPAARSLARLGLDRCLA